MRKMQFAACHPERRTVGSKSKDLLWIFALALTIALVACGGDSGTSANNDKDTELVEVSSSSKAVSSSSVKASSSSVKVSSSSVILSSSSKQSSSSKKVESSSSSLRLSSANLSSSSKKVESSSSEYVPFDHKKTLANSSKVGKDAYKQFTDTRNGRSYYYITITSSKTGKPEYW